MKINMIACVSKNNVIGTNDNKLIYHIKEDMKRFKDLTMGHAVVMGRKTFESIPGHYLPGRENYVITNSTSIHSTNNPIYSRKNIEGLLEDFKNYISFGFKKYNEIFIIGGSSIYEQFLPMADCLYLTEVDDIPEGLEKNEYRYFPEYKDKFKCIEREHHESDKYSYDFTKYVKRSEEEMIDDPLILDILYNK